MIIREKMEKVREFNSYFNAIFNETMTGKSVTSIDWNEKIAPQFRKIKNLIDSLLSKL